MFPSLLHVAAGLVFTLLLGFGVRPLLKYASRSMPVPPPSGATEKQKEQWEELIKGNEGGAVIGWLERIMFFAAFLADTPIAVGAWLAFKVATKWEAWGNIISVPSKIDGLDDLAFFVARRRWGSHVLMTFLVGTAYNIIAALLGATLARQWCQIFNFIGC